VNKNDYVRPSIVFTVKNTRWQYECT